MPFPRNLPGCPLSERQGRKPIGALKYLHEIKMHIPLILPVLSSLFPRRRELPGPRHRPLRGASQLSKRNFHGLLKSQQPAPRPQYPLCRFKRTGNERSGVTDLPPAPDAAESAKAERATTRKPGENNQHALDPSGRSSHTGNPLADPGTSLSRIPRESQCKIRATGAEELHNRGMRAAKWLRMGELRGKTRFRNQTA